MMYSYDEKKYVLETESNPVTINYTTGAGRGVITINPARVFPCTVHDIKTIIDTLWMSADPYTIGAEIADYIRACVAEIQDHRSHYTGPFDAKIRAQLSGMIKKYLSNLDKIAEAFGLEKMSDCEVETMKMKKCEVLCNEVDHTNENGTGRKIAIYSGKTFTKSGIVFQVHQKKKNGTRWITLPGTGSAVTSYSGAEKEAPAHIEERIIDILKSGAENGKLEAVRADFENVCKACGIAPDEMQADLVKPAENTPAPALDAKSETSETRPAADQEPQTAEKPATPATAKKARKDGRNAKTDHNTIKRNTKYIIARALVDTNAGKAGEVVRIYFDNFTGWIIEHENGARFACFIQHIRNTAFYEILSQSETIPAGVEPFTMGNKEKSEEPQTETRADRAQLLTGSPAQGPQVWKPCTMTAGAKNGIIYHDIMGATDRQKPASADRVKALLRLAKMQGYINIGWTAEKPVTGAERSHKDKPAPGGYPPNKDGRNTAATPQARKMPQVTVRGSPQNQGEKFIENVFFQTEIFSKIV